MAKSVIGAPPRRPSSLMAISGLTISNTGFAPLLPPGTSSGGSEVVLCADFDRYGTRLVTGSADHRLRMYERVNETWELVDAWRGHNGMVLDVKFSPLPSSVIPLFASAGEDLRLKIWASDPTTPAMSGRRFFATFSQSAGHAAVAYVSIALAAPAMPSPDLLLAAVTRDGFLSLLEPVPEVEQRAATSTTGFGAASLPGAGRRQVQEWRELDQIYPADEPVPRGTETNFRLAFQPFPNPTSYMNSASIGTKALSLAVASLNEVRIYSILPPASSTGTAPSAFASSSSADPTSYRFGGPLAILAAGNGRLVRDVAWSPAAHRMSAWIAAAAADGIVRVYDIAPPRVGRPTGGNTPNRGSVSDHAGASQANSADAAQSPLPNLRDRVPTGFSSASTLTASLSRAVQAQPPLHTSTSSTFSGAQSTFPPPSQAYANDSDHGGTTLAHGQASAASDVKNGSAAGVTSSRVEAKLVAELAHPDVWRVAWIRTGSMVVSMGDSGQGHVWGPGVGGNWIEIAEFGADSEGEWIPAHWVPKMDAMSESPTATMPFIASSPVSSVHANLPETLIDDTMRITRPRPSKQRWRLANLHRREQLITHRQGLQRAIVGVSPQTPAPEVSE